MLPLSWELSVWVKDGGNIRRLQGIWSVISPSRRSEYSLTILCSATTQRTTIWKSRNFPELLYYNQIIIFRYSILYWPFAGSVNCQILHLYFWHLVWIVWWHCYPSSQKKFALVSPNCSSFLVSIIITRLWWSVSALNISTFSCWVHW
jgi:hypothetical protein